MKKVAIIATGGTIAGTGQLGKTTSYRAGEISVSDIISSIPLIKEVADIETIQLFNVDSNEMNPDKWIELSRVVNEVARRADIDGIVVTHGTDTLDETAYYLNLTLYTQKPVVITGAMRPATATSADGPFNLYQAVCLAGDDRAKDQGVMALFSSTIYGARDIQKVNNYKIDAFDQKSFGCLGYMQDDKVYLYSKTFKTHTSHSIFSYGELTELPEVAIAYFYAGAKASVLKDLAKSHQGIVLVGSGSGNYNLEWQQMIQKLSQEGIVFVRASRVPAGLIFEDEVFDPTNVCIPANTLSPQKARVLLMLALSKTKDLSQLKSIFEQY